MSEHPQHPQHPQGPAEPGPGQPYGQQPYPPQGYYAPPPQKKKHTLRNVLLVVVLLMVLLVGGCLALLGGAANEINDAIEEEAANDKPAVVAEGKAFTHDDFKVDAGWSVEKDGTGGATIEGLRVTNDSDETRSALLTFRFYKGNENLAEVECSSNQMGADEVSTLDCFSFDSKFPAGYTEIKVSDAW